MMISVILIIVGVVISLITLFGGMALIVRLAENFRARRFSLREKTTHSLSQKTIGIIQNNHEFKTPNTIHLTKQKLSGIAHAIGFDEDTTNRIWQQGMALVMAGITVYSPKELVAAIEKIHLNHRISFMWLSLYSPRDREPPFFDLALSLINSRAKLTYLVPSAALSEIDKLRKNLKKDDRLTIDPADVDNQLLRRLAKKEELDKNFALVVAGETGREVMFGYNTIRDGAGRTILAYDMPPIDVKASLDNLRTSYPDLRIHLPKVG